jgi:ferrous iron transport protein B
VGHLFNDPSIEIYDLPGVYSIIPSSNDEGVVSHALINEEYRGIINIVDATALKRNLQLTIQLLEMGQPMTLALNMYDEMSAKGIKVNSEKLSQYLGLPVVNTVASKKEGVDKIVPSIRIEKADSLRLEYHPIIEDAIEKLRTLIPHNRFKRRFVAIQLLTGNREFFDFIKPFSVDQVVDEVIEETEKLIKENTDFSSTRMSMFDTRISFINMIIDDVLEKTNEFKPKTESSTKLDKFLLSPITGVPLFFMVLLGMYFITFNVLGDPISGLIDTLIVDYVIPYTSEFMDAIGLTGFIHALIIDGLFAGVGQVLVFLPQITILFFLLTVLEGTGYMSRVSILFDRFFSKFDLNGKAIVPLVTGIGCNVPAVMSTRTIVDKRERLLTVLIIPFMSCSARIPIYVVFSAAFFPDHAWIVLLSMQLLGATIALASAKLLSVSLFEKRDTTFMLEMPPYRLPQLSNIIRLTLAKGREFIHDAGKYILIGSVVIWILSVFSFTGYNATESNSILATSAGVIAPLFAPIGFGNWQAVSSILSGFLAKELVVASSAIIYGTTESGLTDTLPLYFTSASALSFMVFNLLYIPCLATVGVIKQETNAKWTALSILYSTAVAYIVSFVVYLVASIFM